MIPGNVKEALTHATESLKTARDDADLATIRSWIDRLLDKANDGPTHAEAMRHDMLLEDQ